MKKLVGYKLLKFILYFLPLGCIYIVQNMIKVHQFIWTVVKSDSKIIYEILNSKFR